MAVEVSLEFVPGKRAGQTTVTAKVGDDVLAMDSLDLSKSRDRGQFAATVCKGRSGINREAVEATLLKEAAKKAERHTERPLVDEEVDVSRIIRPELFFTPEVSGVAVPIVVNIGGKPVGRYNWYVKWQDGTRKSRAIDSNLPLPGADQLWVNPLPNAPSISTRPGWSKKGRKLWLDGKAEPNPVGVFRAICRALSHYVEFPAPDQEGITATLAAWIILTYAFPAWPAIPYLYFGGPTGSGKSTIFDILERLVFRSYVSSNLTCASLFRTLDDRGGTLLYDEAERLKDVKSPDVNELNSMLLAGYRKGGTASRTEPNDRGGYSTTSFDVFGPKALACVSGLPPALQTRAIPFTMFRAAPGSKRTRRRISASELRWQNMRDALHVLAIEHGPDWLRLADRRDVCPVMGGRDYELWQPLLAIASFIEDDGANGLLGELQQYALKSIENAKEEQIPACDEVLLRILAEAVSSGGKPTCAELLELARQEDPQGFKFFGPRGVSSHLRHYGFRTKKTNGLKRYADVDLNQFVKIQTSYGVDLDIQAA